MTTCERATFIAEVRLRKNATLRKWEPFMTFVIRIGTGKACHQWMAKNGTKKTILAVRTGKSRNRTTPVAAARKTRKQMNDARNNPSLTPPPQGNVDQIRDIIFGPQMREYESRFSVLAANLEHEAASLRKDLENRFTSLTEKGAKSSEGLSAELKAERLERVELNRRLTAELREISKELERSIRAAEATAERLHRESLKAASDLADEVRAEARAQYDELTERVAAEFSAIHRAKAGREELSAIFTEMAAQVVGNPQSGEKK